MSGIDLATLDDLDPRSLRPLYQQLADRLARAIAAAGVVSGLRLPSEAECVRRFGVSRLTVRQAMGVLETDGLVRRVAGRGTFAVPRPVEHDMSAASFEEDMIETQMAVEPRLLSWKAGEATEPVARALRIPVGAGIWRLERLRIVDAAPLGLEVRILAETIGAKLKLDGLQIEPVFAMVQRITGRRLHRIEHMVGCHGADEREARLLDVPRGAPLLWREHTYFDEAGEPMIHGHNIFRGDRYRFRFETGTQPIRGRLAESTVLPPRQTGVA